MSFVRRPYDDPALLAWKQVDCPACHREYLARLPAETDEGILFHCGDCPERVRVRLDDPMYRYALSEVARQPGAPLSGSRAHWRQTQALLEAELEGCCCGAVYRFDAVRRCWTCAQPLLKVPSPWWSHRPIEHGVADRTRPARWLLLSSVAAVG